MSTQVPRETPKYDNISDKLKIDFDNAISTLINTKPINKNSIEEVLKSVNENIEKTKDIDIEYNFYNNDYITDILNNLDENDNNKLKYFLKKINIEFDIFEKNIEFFFMRQYLVLFVIMIKDKSFIQLLISDLNDEKLSSYYILLKNKYGIENILKDDEKNYNIMNIHKQINEKIGIINRALTVTDEKLTELLNKEVKDDDDDKDIENLNNNKYTIKLSFGVIYNDKTFYYALLNNPLNIINDNENYYYYYWKDGKIRLFVIDNDGIKYELTNDIYEVYDKDKIYSYGEFKYNSSKDNLNDYFNYCFNENNNNFTNKMCINEYFNTVNEQDDKFFKTNDKLIVYKYMYDLLLGMGFETSFDDEKLLFDIVNNDKNKYLLNFINTNHKNNRINYYINEVNDNMLKNLFIINNDEIEFTIDNNNNIKRLFPIISEKNKNELCIDGNKIIKCKIIKDEIIQNIIDENNIDKKIIVTGGNNHYMDNNIILFINELKNKLSQNNYILGNNIEQVLNNLNNRLNNIIIEFDNLKKMIEGTKIVKLYDKNVVINDEIEKLLFNHIDIKNEQINNIYNKFNTIKTNCLIKLNKLGL